MVARVAKKTEAAVRLTSHWQWAFIVTVVAVYAVDAYVTLHALITASHISSSTWTNQMVVLGYPLVLAAVGLWFAWGRTVQWTHRVFWTVFVALLGNTTTNCVQLLLVQVRQANHWFYQGTSDSLWLAFGWEWSIMAVCFVGYGCLLYLIARSGKRA